jgi:membrane protein required for colicin V production
MLITVIALFVVLPGIAGVIRGTLRSLLTFLALLLGAVLVDGWQPSWQNWIVATFDTADPALLIWIAMAGALLAVFLIVGYGLPLLLPRRLFPERLNWRDRALGLLIGLVTGLLVAAYLLHYAAILRPDTAMMALIDGSLVAQVVWMSLPWFMLALVGILGLSILVRSLMIITRSRRKAPATPPPAEPPPADDRATAGAAATETYEPTPLPGTRALPNDETDEPRGPAQAEDAPAQAEPTATDLVPPAETPERDTPDTDTEPAAPEKPDDERDDTTPERR